MINLLRKYRFLVLLLTILLAGILLTYLNLQFTKNNPGGYDFFSNWFGTRAVFFSHQNPYSEEITRQIQSVVPAAQASQFRFSLPLYATFFFSPFAVFSNFPFARALWMTFLEAGIVAILYLSLKLVRWRMKTALFTGLLIFGFFGLHGIRAIMDGGMIIPMTLITIGLMLSLQNRQDEVAGLLLAVSTLWPVPIALFLAFILIWVISQRRWQVIWWFLGAMVLLVGFSLAVFPDWILNFLRNFTVSYKVIDPGSPGGVLASRWGEVGNRFSIIITVVIGILILLEWWQALRSKKSPFIYAAMLTLSLGTWSGIKLSPLNYLLLYPALIAGMELLYERWKGRITGILLSILAILFLANWGIYLLTMSADLKPGISSFLLIPLPIIVTTLLYWSKWWVLKSKDIEFEPNLMQINRS